jgi:hypothetical protein
VCKTIVETCETGIEVGAATGTPGIAQFDGIVGILLDGIYWNHVGSCDGAFVGVM